MKLLAFILLLFLPRLAFGAITFDAQAESAGASTDAVSYTHTVGVCSNPFVVIGIAGLLVDGVPSTVTYNGVSSTLIDTAVATAFFRHVWLYGNVAIPTGGGSTVAVTLTQAEIDWVLSSVSYCGVDQSTPTGTSATGADDSQTTDTPTVNVTAASGDLAIDLMVIRDPDGSQACTAGAGQTERTNAERNFNEIVGQSEESGTGTITMSWTCSSADAWAIVAVPLKSATAGTTLVRRRPILQ